MLKLLRDKGYWLPATMATIAFAIPMGVPTAESNPTSHAGSFASIIAFCYSH